VRNQERKRTAKKNKDQWRSGSENEEPDRGKMDTKSQEEAEFGNPPNIEEEVENEIKDSDDWNTEEEESMNEIKEAEERE